MSANATPTAASTWELHPLKLSFPLVYEMALSSLRVRMSRTVLTLLTIGAASSFLMFLLVAPPAENNPTEDQIWGLMMVLSVLVSAAGVLNTMLMTVTQRYREIGTLKCLGALDAFVLYSVLLEAALLGLAGALAGAAAGFLLAMVYGLVSFGFNLFAHLQLDGWWWKAAVSGGVGLCLTTFGAAVPALIAARMPPIEAMRGEK